MNQSETYTEFTIIGAGIAGLSIADELLNRNRSVCLVDRAEPGSGSSGAPLVLVNPATGRRAKMVPNAADSLKAVRDILERVQQFSGENLFVNNGILRPAPDAEVARDFKRSPEKYNWPGDDWVRWVDEPEYSNRHPWFGSTCGGLEINRGLTVNAPLYIHHLACYLQSRGLISRFNQTVEVADCKDERYRLRFSDGTSALTDHIIWATGSQITEDPEWAFLPFRKTKGQLLHLSFENPLPLQQSVSSMGYAAYMPSSPHQLVIGSTYERGYSTLEPTEKGKNKLYDKLDRMLPGLSKKPHSASLWSGERVSLKDHQPALGRHPENPNSYLFSGLGSKGMIQGRYLAKQLADHILDDKSISRTVDLARFPHPQNP